VLPSRRLLSLALVALVVLTAALRGAGADQTRVVASSDEVRITDALAQAPLALSRGKSGDAQSGWAHLDAGDVFHAGADGRWRLTTAPTRPAIQVSDYTPAGCRPPPGC